MGSIAYWSIGFELISVLSATCRFGTWRFLLNDFVPKGDLWRLSFRMFQVVFVALAATVVSGAMAERTEFSAYKRFICWHDARINKIKEKKGNSDEKNTK